MSACEACWAKAFTIAICTGRHQAEVYHELIRESHFGARALEQIADEVEGEAE